MVGKKVTNDLRLSWSWQRKPASFLIALAHQGSHGGLLDDMPAPKPITTVRGLSFGRARPALCATPEWRWGVRPTQTAWPGQVTRERKASSPLLNPSSPKWLLGKTQYLSSNKCYSSKQRGVLKDILTASLFLKISWSLCNVLLIEITSSSSLPLWPGAKKQMTYLKWAKNECPDILALPISKICTGKQNRSKFLLLTVL